MDEGLPLPFPFPFHSLFQTQFPSAALGEKSAWHQTEQNLKKQGQNFERKWPKKMRKKERKIEIKSETKAKRECNETRNNNRNKRIRKWEIAGEREAYIFGGGMVLGHGREVK